MQKITRVELGQELELPNGSRVTVLEASDTISVRRDPPDNWPAELIVNGPWEGEFRTPWEGIKGWSETRVPGLKPHSLVELTDAKSFIDYLVEDGREADRYLYRGVARSDYNLLPTALRIAAPLPFSAVPKTNREQIEREARMALHFFDSVHFQGLTIPEWNDVRRIMDGIRGGTLPTLWPPDELLQFLAIAQHHGIPTRLLDWTLDPMVAAYFAACDLGADSPFVAVWILDRRAEWSFGGPSPHARLLHPIVVPYDVNRNAHAQRGVFTAQVPLSPNDHTEKPSRMPLDELLSLGAVADPPDDGVRKVTLPRAQIGGLLRRLDRRRINGSTMFPGYSGAAVAAKERAYWA